MPLTTAEMYTKLGVKEGQPLHGVALGCDENESSRRYGETFPGWVNGREISLKHSRLYASTRPEIDNHGILRIPAHLFESAAEATGRGW